MAWIESHQSVATHPKTKRLARILQISIPELVGHLHLLWWWALDFAPDGSLDRYDVHDIADAVMWEGNPQDFVDALITAGYIDRDESGLCIHDWHDYAGKLLDRRASDAARKKALRSAPSSGERSDKTPAGISSEPEPIHTVHPIPTDVQRMSDGRPTDVQRTSSGRPTDGATCPSDVATCPSDGVRNRNRNLNRNHNTLSNERDNAPAGADPPLPSAEICRMWNEIVPNCPKVNTISGQREKMLRARWKEHPDVEWWQALFARIAGSGFLTGQNERGWVATFDWVLKPVNLDKILGGNYDDRASPQPKVSGPQHIVTGGLDIAAYAQQVSAHTPVYKSKEASGT